MSQTPSHYAIARIDLPAQGTHGWQVRMQRHRIKYAKFFSDRSHGSPARALAAAITWRDELHAELANLNQTRVCQKSKRNKSGVVGVSKVRIISATGTVYHFWQATWTMSDGRRGRVRFSVKKHGDRGAFRLAVKARQQGIDS